MNIDHSTVLITGAIATATTVKTRTMRGSRQPSQITVGGTIAPAPAKIGRVSTPAETRAVVLHRRPTPARRTAHATPCPAPAGVVFDDQEVAEFRHGQTDEPDVLLDDSDWRKRWRRHAAPA
jgi:hypothetical protein